MDVYEELGIPVDEEIIHEFLQHEDVAEDVSCPTGDTKKISGRLWHCRILEEK